MTESVRLAKRVADLISCSRSEAEQYIEGGWIQVDGAIVEEPGFRVQQQKVVLMPNAVLAPVQTVTILLNVPPQVNITSNGGVSCSAALSLITPETHASDDRSGTKFLKRHLAAMAMVMPLERNAGGLLVLTQDWRISRKLIDDAAKVEQEYVVEVSGDLMPNGLALLNHGLQWNGKPLAPIKVSWQTETRLRFALKAPQRGQIAHMCEQVGLKVESIKRIRIGRLPLSGLLPGRWRYLLGYEQF